MKRCIVEHLTFTR